MRRCSMWVSKLYARFGCNKVSQNACVLHVSKNVGGQLLHERQKVSQTAGVKGFRIEAAQMRYCRRIRCSVQYGVDLREARA